MDAAVRHARDWLGGSLGEAIALATVNPARVLGLDGRKGRLAAGHDADLVVLDAGLRPVATMVGGRWATAPPA
jgi:N-acetylglucosamine-6-phosphate deacetylase